MFRRKDEEENLFGAPGAAETTTATASAPAASSSTASQASAAASAPAASAAPAARTLPEPRNSTPGVGAFRPASNPLSADITRGRLPETKGTPPAAAADKANKSARRVLTVGNDILLKGEIATCDRLVIEGKVDATLNEVHTVEIAENGSFKGAAHIEDAEISGLFEGELVVRGRLVIYATGKVRGKISYGEIEIERGGELTGEIKIASQNNASRPARSPKEEKSYAAA